MAMTIETESTATDPIDREVEKLRSRIGRTLRDNPNPNLEHASREGIRTWAQAIGDRDPKWVDQDAASRTRWGGITAPPSMLYGFDVRAIGDRGGLRGFHSLFGGARHEWYEPIRLGDAVTLGGRFTDLVEMPASPIGRTFRQVSEVEFRANERLVARSWPWGSRVPRDGDAMLAEYEGLEPVRYSPEDIDRIGRVYEGEHELVRGARTRYFEDVRIGEPVGGFQRGPFTPTVSLTFMKAIGALFMLSHGQWFEYLRRHPGVGIPNSLGVPEGPARAHWEDDFARTTGVPLAYNWGPEIMGWLTTACTYWCGDEGWLRVLDAEVHRFNLMGDLVTVGGEVLDLSVDGSDGIVLGALRVVDQRGDVTATATFEIVLPRRGAS